MSSVRGVSLIKSIQSYLKTKPYQFDTSAVFSKVNLLQAADGHLSGSFTVDSSMCNASDTLHGGYIASIVDVFSVFGCLSHTKGKISWTTNMNIVYLRAAKKGEQVFVQASPLSGIGKSSVIEVTLKNETSGEILAKGVSSLVAGNDYWQKSGYYNGIFIFGSKIFPDEIKQDAITNLPLEMSWDIFLYLDNRSLRAATLVSNKWKMIILSNKRLRSKLHKFNMAISFGCERLATFYRINRRSIKREAFKGKQRSYISTAETKVEFSSKTTTFKRAGESITISSKRMKLH